ncbi:MAG TPA: hypothetical protein VJK02_09305 [Anaerolineales bacterium]|nr:hypothetical protein [Anaerolineales bacterium]
MSATLGDADLGSLWYLDTPTYTIAEASRIVGLTSNRVKRWLEGYTFHYTTKSGSFLHRSSKGPVVDRGSARGTTYASFLNLIDLLYVKQFLDEGLSLQKLRLALEEAKERIGAFHFANQTFFTDGRNIHLQFGDDGGPIMALLTGGQYSIAPIIAQLATRIEFDEVTGYAERYYPLGKKGLVVIDPKFSFGRPTLVGRRGITTANVIDLYRGEAKRLQPVCKWLGLSRREAQAAIGYELSIAA